MDNQLPIPHTALTSNELLLTSLSGTFSYSTLSGYHLKKSHGLFISCIPYFNHHPYVLLSSLNETLFFKQKSIDIGGHLNNNATQSIKFIRNYTIHPLPKIEYSIGDIKLRKEWLLQEGEESLLIKYTLLNTSAALTLQLNPLLSYRRIDALTHANQNHNTLYGETENGLSFKMYTNFPSIHIQCSKPIGYKHQPNWKQGIEYAQDKLQQQSFSEDLYHPGSISISLQAEESVIVRVGTSNADVKMLKTNFETAKEKRKSPIKPSAYLADVARQFFSVQKKHVKVFSSLPFQASTACNFIKALPGLKIALTNNLAFANAELTLIDDLKKAMKNKKTSALVTGWGNSELFLWACWSFLRIHNNNSPNSYFNLVVQIIQSICKGEINGIQLHKNGLITTTPSNTFYTKKDSKNYTLELNAIWYNALRHCEHYLKEGLLKETIKSHASTCKQAFCTVFLNPKSKLLTDSSDDRFDVHAMHLFTISQRYSPLNKQQQQAALKMITSHLYTVNGMRGISPNHTYYNANAQEISNTNMHFGGSALPWLFGSYVDALIKIRGKDSLPLLIKISTQIKKEALEKHGNITASYSGNPPFKEIGNAANLLSISENARTLHTIKKYKKHLIKSNGNFEDTCFGKIYV